MAMTLGDARHRPAGSTAAASGDEAARPSGLRIRTHLAILVLAAALPLIGLIGYGVYAQARLEAEQAAEQALVAARAAAIEGERRLVRTRDLLAYMSRQTLVNRLDEHHCDPIFATFTALFPWYTNLLTVRSDGARVCSAVVPSAGAPAKVDPALYLAETLRTRQFTVGHMSRGIFTGRWILIVAYPLPEVAGEVPGVVAMSIDLARLRLAPELTELPPGAQARIVDSGGVVIAASGAAAAQSIGQRVSEAGWPRAAASGEAATGRLRDETGIERLFASVPVAGTDWRAVITIPADVVQAPSRARARLGAAISVLVLLLVAGLAYAIARRIARPVEAIAAVARGAAAPNAAGQSGLAAGDLDTAPREVRVLADDFVTMLDRRAQAERIARNSEERLQAVIDNLAEGLIICDPESNTITRNPASLRAHGLSPDGPVLTAAEFRAGHEILTLDGELLPKAQWPLERVLRGEPLNGLELRLRPLDRRWERVFSYGGTLLHDAGGRPLGFMTLTDITERHRAQTQLHELNQALEQRVQQRTEQLAAKSKELESFCYSVSHDLKAPLRGIDGYSRLLAEDYGPKLGDEGRKFIDNVRLATRQMTELIEDLLAYSRQERRTLMPTRIELRDFVADQIARLDLARQGVELAVEVEPVSVWADPESLAIALRNLVDNARKFSAHQPHPTVTIGTRCSDGRCVLSVQDNGSGFDMRFHDKIFEIFQRLHRAEDYPGTGVGLALVRKAMDRMGGRVWAEGAPGAGATFYLELALATQASAAGPT